jgi:catechol 2,3-dioxygenase-like lactoylglutathione lyase family enzyme
MVVIRGSSVWPPVPALTVSSVASSLDWYLKVLGFQTVSESYYEGQLTAAHLRWAGYSWLLLVAQRNRFPGISIRCSGIRFCFWTEQDLYALATRAVERGGQIALGPVTYPRGIREVTFRDPDGYLVTFCQRVSLRQLGASH